MNLIGGVVNDNLGYYPGSDGLFSSLILFLLFGLIHLVISQIRMRIRKSLRLPMIRTLFWVIIALPLLLENSKSFHQADLIDAIIPSFCFLASTFAMKLNEVQWLSEIRFSLWGVYIIGVSCYQILVLELSSRIINKIEK